MDCKNKGAKVKCLNIPRTTRNDYIVVDLLQRRHAYLSVRLWRMRSGQPWRDRVLPLSYLLEEKTDYLAKRIQAPPKWFFLIDLESVSCYDIYREPSKRQMFLQKKCDELLDEISILKGPDKPSTDIQSS